MARRRSRTNRKKRSYRKKAAPRTLGARAVSAIGGFALKVLKRKLGLNTEKHYVDTVDVATAPTTTAAAFQTSLLVIPMGDTVNTRTGRSIRITSINLRGLIRADAAATVTRRIRIIIFTQPKIVGGTLLNSADILADSTANFMSPYNMNTSGYKILYDHSWEIAPPGQEGSTREFFWNYRPLQHHVAWLATDTTGLLSNLLEGYVRMICLSDSNTAAPNFDSYVRAKWVDN